MITTLETFLAIEAPRTAFFVQTSGYKTACKLQPNAHATSSSARFCEHCGSPTFAKTVEEPSEGFRAFCAARDINPEFTFHRLQENEWVWGDYGGDHKFGYHEISLVAYRKDEQRYFHGLGFHLGSHHTDQPDYHRHPTAGYSIDELTKLTVPLLALAKQLKIEGTPKLYSQILHP